jgi:hypothetical protein
MFKLTYNKYFGNKVPANIFEGLLKILGTIGALRKEEIRSSQKEIEQKKQDLIDSLILSKKEREFFVLAINSPTIENRYLIDAIITRE